MSLIFVEVIFLPERERETEKGGRERESISAVRAGCGM